MIREKVKTIYYSLFLLLITILITSTVIATVDPFCYVDDDADSSWYDETHVKTIQEAMTNASDEWTIIIMNGSYIENINVNITVTIIGESIDGANIQPENSMIDVFTIESDNVTIKQLTITNSTSNGIFSNVDYVTLESIHFHDVKKAIKTTGSDNIIISNCTFINSKKGIEFILTNNVQVSNNIFCNNTCQAIFTHKVDTGLFYNNTISNNAFHCIGIFDSNMISFINNTFENNSYDGLSINFANNISIVDNIFINNQLNGIYFNNTENSNISNNKILNNNVGINCVNSDGNDFEENTINSNEKGIYFDNTTALIHSNRLQDNSIGLQLESSKNNIVYNNYFDNINNIEQTGSIFTTYWNITKIPGINILGGNHLGGNYWSDYTYFDIEENDGLGETPYYINGINGDYLPLCIANYELYVDDDANESSYDATHVKTIQEAINNASYGAKIYIKNGIYYNSTNIDKNVHITGESIDNVICTNTSNYFFNVTYDNVIIENLTIFNSSTSDSGYAIINQGNFSIFSNLNFFNNKGGIALNNSNHVLISDNNFTDNLGSGILLTNSSNNTLTRNLLKNNSVGLNFKMANNNTIYDNYLKNNIDVNLSNGSLNNKWNHTKTHEINIIEGPYIGGNYWGNYIGFDNNTDGLGDTAYIIDSFNNINDSLPLINYFYLHDPEPSNGSTNNNPGSLTWKAYLDYHELLPPLCWSIECNNGQKINDTIQYKTLYLDLDNLQYGNSYTIWVNITDEIILKEYVFTFDIIDKNNPKPPKNNKKPVSIISSPLIAFINESITINGNTSYDPDGYITNYTWDLDNGKIFYNETIIYQYLTEGTYTIKLTVTDNKGSINTTQRTISIIKGNNPPVLDVEYSKLSKISVQFSIISMDPDEDLLICTINWGDDSPNTILSLSNQELSVKNHTYSKYGSYEISIVANDSYTTTPYSFQISLSSKGDSPESSKEQESIFNLTKFFSKEGQLVNKNANRSLLNGIFDKKTISLLATIISILLLFLMNYLVEFSSDYFSEKAKNHFDNKKERNWRIAKLLLIASYFVSHETFAKIVSILIFSFVITWAWVPDFSDFILFFIFSIFLVSIVILSSETLRKYLCKKHNLCSEFAIWPLGSLMMIVSTFIGNTFSLTANQNYSNEDNIKKCGRVSFIVSILLFILVIFGYLFNIFYPSIFIQMFLIITILNLFIDLFPFKPMDGYDIRRWNFPIWITFYILILISYFHIYLQFEI